MNRLSKAFESLGFANVKTLLASGNVLFAGQRGNTGRLVRRIEAKLEKTFGMKSASLSGRSKSCETWSPGNPSRA